MNLLPTQVKIRQQHNGLGISMLVGKILIAIYDKLEVFGLKIAHIDISKQPQFRFLDPLINGQYPKVMQDIVKDRLPKFTPEQAKLVKGSSDYFGINQYTTNYISNQQTPQQTPTSYSSDWGVQYNCELPTCISSYLYIYYHYSYWRYHYFSLSLGTFAVQRNGVQIGQLVWAFLLSWLWTLVYSIRLFVYKIGNCKHNNLSRCADFFRQIPTGFTSSQLACMELWTT